LFSIYSDANALKTDGSICGRSIWLEKQKFSKVSLEEVLFADPKPPWPFMEQQYRAVQFNFVMKQSSN
jgi:hypothetical protein